MKDGPNIARIAALIGDHARAEQFEKYIRENARGDIRSPAP